MHYQLAIDRGNSQTKVSIAQNGNITEARTCSDDSLFDYLHSIQSIFAIDAIMLSNVREADNRELLEKLHFAPLFQMSHRLKFPFDIRYSSPETLGHDRLANIAGASVTMPLNDVLVIDFGTCITYSLLVNKTFLGGSIAPGISMRYKALHEFTGNLPLVHPMDDLPMLLGDSTQNSIVSGVQMAVLLETDAMIAAYREQYNRLQVIITGGNHSFFENSLKSSIFAVSQLTQIGLHETLRINRS
jgi:type III pantothenate kinase